MQFAPYVPDVKNLVKNQIFVAMHQASKSFTVLGTDFSNTQVMSCGATLAEKGYY